MKKILCAVLLFMISVSICSAAVRNIQDNHLITYSVLDINATPVSGQTVTLMIKKASNGYWYDFSDDTFKASNLTTSSTTLYYDTTGRHYYYLFNPPASETSANQYLFILDNANATYRDHQVFAVDYQNIGTSTFAGGAVASVTGNVGGNVLGNVAGNVQGSVASVVSAPTEQSIANALLDEALNSHLTSGSVGYALNAASSSGDPLATAVPGNYAPGTMGYVVGNWASPTIDYDAIVTNILSADASSGYEGKLGGMIRSIYDATDGDTENGAYSGIERLIRIHR